MATSQNGWTVLPSPPSGTIPEFVTGRVRPEDVDVVFTYALTRIHAEVEKIKLSWTWGWAFRLIRAATGWSNHASATAVDINAPAHPLGVRGTWSATQKARMHQILADLDHVLRWGEDYSGRVDGMHLEVNVGGAELHRVAEKIRNGQMPGQRPDWEPNEARAVHFGRVQEQFLIAIGAQDGEVVRLNGVGIIQDALNKALGLDLVVDGYAGKSTANAWGQWENLKGGTGRPRVPDRTSVEELAAVVGFDIVGEPWDQPVESGRPKARK